MGSEAQDKLGTASVEGRDRSLFEPIREGALLGQSGASPCVTPHLQSTIAGQWKRYRWYLRDKKRWLVSSENEPQS